MEISQKIIDYAIWYYLRYYPSRKKLAQKLDQKFGPDSEKWKKYGWISGDEIQYILGEKLRNIIQEREVCRSKINNLIQKNKNVSYIKNNLRQKLFDTDMIEEILQSEFHYHEISLLISEKVYKKVWELKRKWKSISYIKQKLIERDLDKELVENIVLEYFPDGDTENLQAEYEKLHWKYEKQKLVDKLIRKWFYYGDIKQLFIEPPSKAG